MMTMTTMNGDGDDERRVMTMKMTTMRGSKGRDAINKQMNTGHAPVVHITGHALAVNEHVWKEVGK